MYWNGAGIGMEIIHRIHKRTQPDLPQAAAVCCVAAVGTSTLGAVVLLIVTTTTCLSATASSVSD